MLEEYRLPCEDKYESTLIFNLRDEASKQRLRFHNSPNTQTPRFLDR
jgi:hypothetical protein